MLIVKSPFADNLYTEMLLRVKDNPCLCKISDIFEIVFFETSPEVTGVVQNWNLVDLDRRVPAGAGGNYFHYKYGLITITHQENDLYVINSLKMFVHGDGWVPVIENKEYIDIVEEEEPGWLKNM